MVAKRFHQVPGIDFNEIFSPVVKPSTVQIVLSLIVSKGWDVHHIDVNNEFLNRVLAEDVYMLQLEGFVDDRYLHYVCKLYKALYRLK